MEAIKSSQVSVKSSHKCQVDSRARSYTPHTERSRTDHASSKRRRRKEGPDCRTYPNTRKRGTQGPQYPQPKRQEDWSTARSALTTRERQVQYRTLSRKKRLGAFTGDKKTSARGHQEGGSALASRDARRRRDDARVSEHRAALPSRSSGYPHDPAVTAIILSWGAFGRAAKACGASWQQRRIGGGCKRT